MQRLLIILGVIIMSAATGTNAATAQDVFSNQDGVALGGYDVVSYFTNNEPMRGSNAHSAEYMGATYYFASDEHRQQFADNPSKYVPAYGGYCAFAMAVGNGKVPSDPRTFKLYNGRLYLFFNDYYQGAPFNTIVPWNADEANLKVKADENWRKEG